MGVVFRKSTVAKAIRRHYRRFSYRNSSLEGRLFYPSVQHLKSSVELMTFTAAEEAYTGGKFLKRLAIERLYVILDLLSKHHKQGIGKDVFVYE